MKAAIVERFTSQIAPIVSTVRIVHSLKLFIETVNNDIQMTRCII
jgi:hypothetical protein